MPTTILLAEDDEQFRHLTRLWLENLGYRVIEAENGEVGWELVRRHLPDMVIADLAMPEMDGTELCRLIKHDEKMADIPVIILTGHAEAQARLAGTEAGADAYIQKDPEDYAILQARIEALLRERARHMEATQRKVNEARKQTISQTVITLAHHLNNSLMAIHATAGVVDPNRPDHARTLQRVCLTEVRKMFTVLRALKRMAEQETLKTTVYVGRELMYDLEQELRQLDEKT